MSTQPEALRLADGLLTKPICDCNAWSFVECSCDTQWPEQYMEAAAAELRRLFAENEMLKAQSNK